MEFGKNLGQHLRLDREGDADHFLRGCHLQIELGLYHFPEEMDIPVLHVAPVFSQVSDASVRAGHLHDPGCCDRIWIFHTPRLPERCNVIDIDT